MNTDFILGMGKVGEAVKILLDINKVLATDGLQDVARRGEAAGASQG